MPELRVCTAHGAAAPRRLALLPIDVPYAHCLGRLTYGPLGVVLRLQPRRAAEGEVGDVEDLAIYIFMTTALMLGGASQTGGEKDSFAAQNVRQNVRMVQS